MVMAARDFYRIRSNPKNGRKRRTVTGGLVNKEMVGYCHLEGHPGYLTVKLMGKHECLKKDCPFLEKNPDHDFWHCKEFSKRKRQLRKSLDSAFKNDVLSASDYSRICRQLCLAKKDSDLNVLEAMYKTT